MINGPLFVGPEYSRKLITNTKSLLLNLNYDISQIEINDNLNNLAKLKIDGIGGKGYMTFSFLRSHVVPSTKYIKDSDIGREVSITLSTSEEPIITSIISLYDSPAILYNITEEMQTIGYPAILYQASGSSKMFYVIYEDEIEETTLSISFVDTGEVLYNNLPLIYEGNEPSIGEIYVNFPPDYDITSTIDHSEDITYSFQNMGLLEVDGTQALYMGNPIMWLGPDYLKDNGDQILLFYIEEDGGGYTMIMLPKGGPSEGLCIESDIIRDGINSYFGEIFSETPGAEYLDFYYPLLSDLVIEEAYIQNKLDEKWVNIDTSIKPAGDDSYEIGGIYVPSPWETGLELDTSDGRLAISPSYVASKTSQYLAGNGLTSSGQYLNVNTGNGIEINNGIALKKATQTQLGGIQIVAVDDVLYISNDGLDPVR